ncbi:cation diffusion facilitator family transporter [Thermonema rossianum]|uniref:cation diffusion facilitator family transporter n=1 Tax=Thermonema rossianum TaxID=55505 RepID=UPI00056FE0A2|nr:cation diffusion facilitator family transporter [Thermonema rossianum]
MGHQHHHAHGSHDNIRTAFWLNAVFTIIEIGGGYWSGSIAILSDALHDLGDTIALGLAWYFERLSRKQGNSRYSYGYGRYSVFGAIVSACILLSGSIAIIIHAVERLQHPVLPHTASMIPLAVLGVLVNGWAAYRLSHGQSLNEKVVTWHLIEDVAGWALVLLGALLMHWQAWAWVDPVMSLLLSVVICYNAVRKLLEAIKVVMQAVPREINYEAVVHLLKTPDEVLNLHDLHIWSLDGQYHILTVHLVVIPGLSRERLCTLKQELRHRLDHLGIAHATFEIEQEGEECGMGCETGLANPRG